MSQKIDILLIEDEPNIAEAVRFILDRAGWQVDAIADGLGALAAIRSGQPRLVILDLMLPGRSGQEILTELRSDPELAGTPVLLLTAQGAAAQAAMREGQGGARVDAILSKPFANDELRALVRHLLEQGPG